MSTSPSRAVPGLILAALSLLSAFLLFQVQPIISKFILPWFGGSPGVWTTCMLFFQVVLFAGYAYAHTLTLLPRRWQGILHGVLLGAAIAMLPIAPSEMWKPTGMEDPALRILLLLFVSVGLPYFVLSSTSPLVQVWFTRTTNGASPWRLYALSNIGSLAALLSYPLFFEVHWDVVEQTTLWAVGFGAFVVLSLAGIWLDRTHAIEAESKPVEVVDTAADHPGWLKRIQWVLLPALASCVLLSATNHVCQDVAVIPFLWVVPLSLYLLTFIICFEHERWYARICALWALLALPVLFLTCTESRLQGQPMWSEFEKMMHTHVEPLLNQLTGQKFHLSNIDLTPNFIWELGWSFSAMFIACMLCHGELTRLKPAPRRLTEFYLLMSFGGALGGLFVSLGAPHLFTTFAEWPISLIVVAALACYVLLRSMLKVKKVWEWLLALLITGATGWLIWELNQNGILTYDMLKQMMKHDAMPPAAVIYGTLGIIGLCLALLIFRFIQRGRMRPAMATITLLGIYFTIVLLMMKDFGFKHDEQTERVRKIERVRNFYGMLSVSEETYDSDGETFKSRQLTNGGIIHGMQHLDASLKEEPTSYYGRQTGIGKALDSLKDRPDARVGVVGMGAGTVACYARSGQTFRFYDINPEVVRIAEKYFTYLEDAKMRDAKVEIVVSDARLALEREQSQQFDVLLLDAFSGDSVPVHLLTKEAFTIYDRHMKPDGIIAVHITNTYLVLAPVIEKIAAANGFKTTRIATEAEDDDIDSTDYILVTRNEAFLKATPPDLLGNETELKEDVRLWTDRYHNLLRILNIPQNTQSPKNSPAA
ncbi:MAG: fused MFS/spermidine synthase [Prosthecobacter sp.]|uniref:spermidine synthase n=1 Tax=Prosthecobacter sp. TaxID=1965333 RepID=UPI0025D6955D|nr:fused MFS/spermidine synthase [Prosthecobacter sp.]MCF7784940.1 fused MFS/spermidine synthase [Prosthecobacter sp.]